MSLDSIKVSVFNALPTSIQNKITNSGHWGGRNVRDTTDVNSKVLIPVYESNTPTESKSKFQISNQLVKWTSDSNEAPQYEALTASKSKTLSNSEEPPINLLHPDVSTKDFAQFNSSIKSIIEGLKEAVGTGRLDTTDALKLLETLKADVNEVQKLQGTKYTNTSGLRESVRNAEADIKEIPISNQKTTTQETPTIKTNFEENARLTPLETEAHKGKSTMLQFGTGAYKLIVQKTPLQDTVKQSNLGRFFTKILNVKNPFRDWGKPTVTIKRPVSTSPINTTGNNQEAPLSSTEFDNKTARVNTNRPNMDENDTNAEEISDNISTKGEIQKPSPQNTNPQTKRNPPPYNKPLPPLPTQPQTNPQVNSNVESTNSNNSTILSTEIIFPQSDNDIQNHTLLNEIAKGKILRRVQDLPVPPKLPSEGEQFANALSDAVKKEAFKFNLDASKKTDALKKTDDEDFDWDLEPTGTDNSNSQQPLGQSSLKPTKADITSNYSQGPENKPIENSTQTNTPSQKPLTTDLRNAFEASLRARRTAVTGDNDDASGDNDEDS